MTVEPLAFPFCSVSLFSSQLQQIQQRIQQEMDASEVGSILRHPAAGSVVLGCVAAFPTLHLEADASPITRQVLRVVLRIKSSFNWRVCVIGGQGMCVGGQGMCVGGLG